MSASTGEQVKGVTFDLILDTEKTIVGYSAVKLKYQKPIPDAGVPIETGEIDGTAYGTGTLKIRATVLGSLLQEVGGWEFITKVEFADGRVLYGVKPFRLSVKEEFDGFCSC